MFMAIVLHLVMATIIKAGLINLWNNGFTYKNLPLIYYHQSYGDNSINIAYIMSKKIINHQFEYDDTEKYTPNDEVKRILRELR